MTTGDEQRLRELYASFNARDVAAVLAATTADVDRPNAWEGGRVIGHAAVRDYWTGQWQQLDPRVEPESIVTRSDRGCGGHKSQPAQEGSSRAADCRRKAFLTRRPAELPGW